MENFNDYTKNAIQLSFDKNKILRIKEHLKKDENTKKLFDSKTYTQNLEKTYKEILK